MPSFPPSDARDWRGALVSMLMEFRDAVRVDRGAVPLSAPEGPWKVLAVDPTGGVQMYFIQRGDDEDEIVTNGSHDFTNRRAAEIVCDALNLVDAARASPGAEPRQ
jgi:hypothetical protein